MMAWNVLNDAINNTSLRGYLRSTFGSGLNAVEGGAPRTVNPLGAWRHLLSIFDAPLNNMEISEAKMEWQQVEIATHVGSSPRTVQNLHNLLYSIDYKMPLAYRHSEEEMARKILMCMSKFDTYLRGKCHDIINGEPGQRGSCKRGTAIYENNEDGVPMATGEYNFTLSLKDVLTYFGKLWETRIESHDLPILSPTNDVSRSSENEAHAAAPGPRRAAPGPRRTVSEHAFTVRRPSGGFNRRNSLEALYAAGFKDMDNSFVTSSDFAALDQDELADALRNGGVRHGCYSISIHKDANGVESVEIICYNCFGLGHTVRSCPSPKKSRELDFVIETLTELDKRRKQNPRAGPPNRVAYG